jgi:hypothetical protein
MKSQLFTLLALSLMAAPALGQDIVEEPTVVVPPPPPAQEFTGDARLEMDNEAPLVGDRIEYVLTVTLPAGWTLEAPEELHFIAALRPQREEVVLRRTESGEGLQTELIVPFVLVRAGRIKIPPRSFDATGPGGEAGIVKAGKISFHTGSYFANETDPKPADPFGPLPVVEKNWLLIWVLVGLGVVVIAVGGTLLIVSRLKPRTEAPGPPPRPAHELALEELKKLAGSNLDKEGQFALYYTELSSILRNYLGNRWGFDSMDLTSTELCQRLESVTIAHEHFQEVALLLDELDLVKFAKVIPSQTRCDADVNRAEALVLATMERPVPQLESVPRTEAAPQPETAPQLEAAPLPEAVPEPTPENDEGGKA